MKSLKNTFRERRTEVAAGGTFFFFVILQSRSDSPPEHQSVLKTGHTVCWWLSAQTGPTYLVTILNISPALKCLLFRNKLQLINWRDDQETELRFFKTKRQDKTLHKTHPKLTRQSNGRQLGPTGVQWSTLHTGGSGLWASLAGWLAKATLPKKSWFLQLCVCLFLLCRLKRAC